MQGMNEENKEMLKDERWVLNGEQHYTSCDQCS
jgi:hypothetical protein